MPTEQEVYELSDLDVDEVSLVDHPANRRRFLIVKREEGSQVAGETNATATATAVPGWEDPGTWVVLLEMAAEDKGAVSKQLELFVSGVITTEADIQLDQEVAGKFSGRVLSTYGSYAPGPAPAQYQRPGLLKVEGVIELPQGLKLGQEFEAPGRFTVTAPYGQPDAVPTREAKVAGKLVLPEGRALDEGGEVQVFLRTFPPAGYAYPYPYPYPAPKAEEGKGDEGKDADGAQGKDAPAGKEVQLALPEEFRKALEEAADAVKAVSEAVEGLKGTLGRVAEDVAALGKRVEALEKAVPTSKRLSDDGEGKDEKRGFWDGVVPRLRR